MYIKPVRRQSYTALVQPNIDEDGNLQPMVIDSKGRIIVDSYGYIQSLKACPSGVNCVGQKTQTSGIQEAINYVWNNGGGRVYIKNGTYNLPSPLGTGYNASPILPPLEIIGESMEGVILQGQTPGIYIVNNTAGNAVFVQYLLLKNLTFKSTYPTPSSSESNTVTVNFSYAGPYASSGVEDNIIIWENVHVIGTQGTNANFSDFLNGTPNTIRVMDNVIWENVPGWNINVGSDSPVVLSVKNYKVIVGPGPGIVDNAVAINNSASNSNIFADMDFIFDGSSATNSAFAGSGWLVFAGSLPSNIYGRIRIKALNTGNVYAVINGSTSFANIEIDGSGSVGNVIITGANSYNKYKVKINGTGWISVFAGSGYGYNEYDIDVTLTSSMSNLALFGYDGLPSSNYSTYDRIKIKFNSPNGSIYNTLINGNTATNVLVEEAYISNWPAGRAALNYLGNRTSNRINWKKVIPYPNIFLNDLFGGSYYNGPFPNLSSSISANTVYQNNYYTDVYVIVQVTMNQTSTASASASIQVGSSSTSLTAYEQVSEPAGTTSGQVKTLRALVPLGWYYEIATSNATINAVYIEPA